MNTLTASEFDVLVLIAKGYSNALIAKQLSLTIGTVKTAMWRLFTKLEINNETYNRRVKATLIYYRWLRESDATG